MSPWAICPRAGTLERSPRTHICPDSRSPWGTDHALRSHGNFSMYATMSPLTFLRDMSLLVISNLFWCSRKHALINTVIARSSSRQRLVPFHVCRRLVDLTPTLQAGLAPGRKAGSMHGAWDFATPDDHVHSPSARAASNRRLRAYPAKARTHNSADPRCNAVRQAVDGLLQMNPVRRYSRWATEGGHGDGCSTGGLSRDMT